MTDKDCPRYSVKLQYWEILKLEQLLHDLSKFSPSETLTALHSAVRQAVEEADRSEVRYHFHKGMKTWANLSN